MPLERDYVLIYGPKEIVEDGVRIRNKVLQPCGCWAAEVSREVAAPDGVRAITLDGKDEPIRKQWCPETKQCHTHAAAVAVSMWKLGNVHVEQLGDGARRLYADTDRVLAEAAALDRELAALGGNRIPKKQLDEGKK